MKEITEFYSRDVFNSVNYMANYHMSRTNSLVDCHIWTRNETCLHSHMDYYEMNLVLSGKTKYESAKIKTVANKGCLFFTKKTEYHIFLQYKNVQSTQITVCLQEKVFEDILEEFGIKSCNNIPEMLTVDDTTFNYLIKLTDIILKTETNFSYLASVKHWASSCLLSVYYSYLQERDYPSWFLDYVSIMNENLSKKLKEIMPMFHCSPTTLNKYFKQYTQMTPNDFFLSQKIKYAKNLLLHTDKSTLTISLDIGFDSLSHFNHAFKDFTGCTPSQFRKNKS